MPGFLGMLAQGFANAGENVAKFASDAATIQMKADLEDRQLQLANQLKIGAQHQQNVETGVPEDVQTKRLNLAMAQARAQSLGITPPGGDTAPTGQSTPSTPATSTSGSGTAGGTTPDSVVVAGSGKFPTVTSSMLPPGMSSETARWMSLNDPEELAKTIAEWHKPQNVRPNSSLTTLNEGTGTVGEIYKNTSPVTPFTDADRQKFGLDKGDKGYLDESGKPVILQHAENPNAPFNPDGSPNPAYQQWEFRKAAAGKEPAVAYDNPVLVEINDGQGGTKEVTAQQNKTTGQWTTADEKHTPLDASGLRVIKSELPGGGRVAGQVIRITTAAHDIASELENISQLPSGASSGLFPKAGLQGTPLGALARTVTTQEVQSYKTSAVGINRAMASLEAAGLAPPGSLANQFEGLQLQEGDTELTKMQKMATMRQQASNSIDAILASPLLSKQQREEVTGLKARMEAAIPWTPQDVIKLINTRNPQATLGDVAKQNNLANMPRPKSAAERDALPPGTTYLAPDGSQRVR